MNASKFRLGFPYYYGDGEFYALDVDYRWKTVINFINKAVAGTSTLTEYKEYQRALSILSTETDSQQTILIGDYSRTSGQNRVWGFIIPQWIDIASHEITKARWGDNPSYTFVNLIDLINPIISALRVSTTIYYNNQGQQVPSTDNHIIMTVDILGFRLEQTSKTYWPGSYNSNATNYFMTVEPNELSTGYKFGWTNNIPSNGWCYGYGNYVATETYAFDKLVKDVVSTIVSEVSKQFVQR